MKDYEHVVVWLDYFNKNLKRSRGRRQGMAKCVHDPSLKELAEAAAAAGLEVSESDERVRHPRRPYVRSGYVVVPKARKAEILDRISERLVAGRARRPRQSA